MKAASFSPLRVTILLIVVFVFLFFLTQVFLSGIDHELHSAIEFKTQEGVSLSAPARTAIGVLCSKGKLRPGLRHDDPEVGLMAPAKYAGVYVRFVSISVPEQNLGKVVIAFNRMEGPGNGGKEIVKDGATVIYRGVCGSESTTWSIDPASTVPKEYWPKL